ncbi:MAG: PorV/PorQ family protein [candidate division KSB1 bacterium]|nr:PorV/PorQ family protein [candidate division KSB1 bacterium]
MKRSSFITLLVIWISTLIAASHVQAQSKVGTSAVPFLGMSVSARATAMGTAFVGVADDATSLYYNPGGIVNSGPVSLAASYTDWILDTQFNWVGFIYNVDGSNALGLSVTYLNYGEEPVTTVTSPEGTGEMWSAGDLALSLSYARTLTDKFSIGGSAKYIQSTIWNETATSFAFDVGLLFTTPFDGMKLGMSISNFGTEMQYSGQDLINQIDLDPDKLGHNESIVANLKTQTWPLPLFFRVGLSKTIFETSEYSWLLAIDALRPSDNQEQVNIGNEIGIYDRFFVRAGYQSLFEKDREEGLTAGFGLSWPMANGMTWNLDYTYATYGILEKNIHMFALGFEL